MASGMTGMYGQYTGPMTDRAEYEDLLGGRSLGSMMGGDAYSQAMIEDMLLGGGDQYSPGGIQAPPMFPEEQMNPQEYIRGQLDQMQLAGDVVPMYGGKTITPEVMERFNDPGVYAQSRGARSIGQMNYHNPGPYLDLLNILAFPSGRSMAPPIRR